MVARIAFLSVAATCVVAFGGLTCILLGMRGNPMVQSGVKIAAAIVYGLWVVRFVFWVRRSWLTQTVWRRPTLVRIVERNEAHATCLTTYSESLLRYVKDSLKGHTTKVNGRMDGIFSKKGALPIFAGASLIWHNWANIQKYMSGLLDSGSTSLVARYGAVSVAVIFGWFLLMRLGVWWSMSNYTFQMEIVETALRMKEVAEDEQSNVHAERSAIG